MLKNLKRFWLSLSADARRAAISLSISTALMIAALITLVLYIASIPRAV